MNQALLDKVIELRRRTDAPAMVCRKALSSCEWDMEQAEAHIKAQEGKYHGVLITTRTSRHG